MMPHLVSDHVRMGELSGSPELSGHDIEKTQVEANDAILRAVEGPGGRLALAAGGRITVAKQTKLGILIGQAALAEGSCPHGLGAAQYLRDEFCLWIIGGRAFRRLIDRILRGW